MKNKIIIFICLLLLPISVNAKNKIYNIDMHINILQDGSANITETWDVDGDDGTEWYKVINNLGESEVTNYIVSMDGEPLTYKTWDVDENLSQKRGYYGINYTNEGLELCFGKYDYNRHKFVLNYTISNFVFNTDDSQVVYFNLIDRLSDIDFDNFSVTLSSYYSFPDTLDVWGYGYKGYAYVNNGIIGMSNEENSNMNGNYVVLLAKFPLNTFTNNVRYSQFNTFDDVYNMAEKGSYKYNYDENVIVKFFSNIYNHIIFFIEVSYPILFLGIMFFLVFLHTKDYTYKNYSYKDNKKINKKEVSVFRDIPCNKDIYYANALIYLNNFNYKHGNILGAIILKWIKENKIRFLNIRKGIFNRETSVIDLTLKPTFKNKTEERLFKMLKSASKDGMLGARELEVWCFKNSNMYLGLFKGMINKEKKRLMDANHIIKAKKSNKHKIIVSSSSNYLMDDTIYEDSIKLYGLKKYLLEFSNMKEKQIFDVHLWDEYLMFAYLFGIADKVAKQLKDMYPEEIKNNSFNYDTMIFISNITVASSNYAKMNNKTNGSSSSTGSSYSSGGGGFSSGGGGGGSFGGGGGGSR